MNLGKVFHDRNLQLSWYTQNLPGKDEEDVVGEAGDVQPDDPEDDYTPPQEDYLPPGLVVSDFLLWASVRFKYISFFNYFLKIRKSCRNLFRNLIIAF